MTSLPFLRDVHPTPTREVSNKAVKPAEGATSELESRCLNALRRQRFASVGALAKFIKQPDADVRDAVTNLIGRGLVKWQDASIDAAGSGYVASDFAKVAPSKGDDKARVAGVRSWIDSLDAL